MAINSLAAMRYTFVQNSPQAMLVLTGAAAVVPTLVEGLFRFLHTLVTSGEAFHILIPSCCSCILNAGTPDRWHMQHDTNMDIGHAVSACSKRNKKLQSLHCYDTCVTCQHSHALQQTGETQILSSPLLQLACMWPCSTDVVGHNHSALKAISMHCVYSAMFTQYTRASYDCVLSCCQPYISTHQHLLKTLEHNLDHDLARHCYYTLV